MASFKKAFKVFPLHCSLPKCVWVFSLFFSFLFFSTLFIIKTRWQRSSLKRAFHWHFLTAWWWPAVCVQRASTYPEIGVWDRNPCCCWGAQVLPEAEAVLCSWLPSAGLLLPGCVLSLHEPWWTFTSCCVVCWRAPGALLREAALGLKQHLGHFLWCTLVFLWKKWWIIAASSCSLFH